jgi:transglutaminase-like putative cysteine protease
MKLNRLLLVALMSLGGLAAAEGKSGEVQPKKAFFKVKNVFTVNVPKDAKTVRIWFAVPQEDAQSSVRNLTVNTDGAVRYETDSWGNRVGFLERRAPSSNKIVVTEEFELMRSEIRNQLDPANTRPLTPAERTALSRYLQPATHVIINDQIKSLSASIVGTETNPVRVARKIYDWTLNNVEYWVKDPDHLKASPVGSSEYCLTKKTGNCTDFHSLYASLAMASGLPTRMVYGSLLKPTLNGLEIDGSYHCWIQFFAPQIGWVPLDVSLANIYAKEFPLSEKNKKLVELTTATGYKGVDPSKVDYYFGNLDERRVTWSTGRDLILQPAQQDGPVNALTKAYVEVDGKQHTDWTRDFSYSEMNRF